MATDIISPIFEITLLEAVVPFVAICVGLAPIFTLLYIHHRQHGLQQKLVSAQLSLKMLEYWDVKQHKDFSDMIEHVSRSEVKEADKRIGCYLSIWEEIAVFCNEETITKNHMRELFCPDLENIRSNEVVYGYLKEKHTKTTYCNLWKLMKKTCEPCNS